MPEPFVESAILALFFCVRRIFIILPNPDMYQLLTSIVSPIVNFD